MKLLDTVYKSGPKDELIVKDVYEAQSSSVYNSFQESLQDALRSIDRIPNMGGGLLSQITGAINKARSMIGNPAALTGLIGGGKLGNISSLISGGANLGNIKNMAANIFGSMGGISQAVSIVNTIDSIIKNPEAILKGFTNGLLSGLTTRGGLESATGGLLSQVMGGNGSDFAQLLMDIATSTDYSGSNKDKALRNVKKSSVDVDASLSDIYSGYGSNITSSLIDMPASVKSSFVGAAERTDFSSDVYIATTNTATRLASGDKVQAVKPLVELIGNITGGKYEAEITNKNEQAALISAVTQLAVELNLPDVFNTIAETVEDETILQKAAAPLLRQAVYDGNFELVRQLANSKIAKSLKSIAPDTTGAIVKLIKKPEGIAQQDYSKYYQSIRISLDAIDDKWKVYDRGETQILNASMFCKNFFIGDLIRAQMNELMSPDTYYSNLQSVYKDRVSISTDVTRSLGEVVYNNDQVIIDRPPVDLSNVEPEQSGNFGTEDLGVLSTELKIRIPAIKKVAPAPAKPTIEVDYADFLSYADYVKFVEENKGYLGDITLADLEAPKEDDTDEVEQEETVVTINFDDEPVMLVATMFCQDTVDECLKRDFPEWYQTLDVTPIGTIAAN